MKNEWLDRLTTGQWKMNTRQKEIRSNFKRNCWFSKTLKECNENHVLENAYRR